MKAHTPRNLTPLVALLISGTLITAISALLLAVTNVAHAHDHAAPAAPLPGVRLIVSDPVAPLLAKGLLVVPFRTEQIRILPVYGEAAAQVAPRIGHLHITIDRAAWHWVHSSDEPIVIQGLARGPHQLTVELADPTHRVVASKELEFTMP